MEKILALIRAKDLLKGKPKLIIDLINNKMNELKLDLKVLEELRDQLVNVDVDKSEDIDIDNKDKVGEPILDIQLFKPQPILEFNIIPQTSDDKNDYLGSYQFTEEDKYPHNYLPKALESEERNKKIAELEVPNELIVYLRLGLLSPYKEELFKEDEIFLRYLINNNDIHSLEKDIVQYIVPDHLKLNEIENIDEVVDVDNEVYKLLIDNVYSYLEHIGNLIKKDKSRIKVVLSTDMKKINVDIKRKMTHFSQEVSFTYYRQLMSRWGFLFKPIIPENIKIK
jgi:hypothetical protein